MASDFLFICLSLMIRLSISETKNPSGNLLQKYPIDIVSKRHPEKNTQELEVAKVNTFNKNFKKGTNIHQKSMPLVPYQKYFSSEESKLWALDTQWIKSVLATRMPNQGLQVVNGNNNKSVSSARRQFSCPLRPPADLWMHCQDLITPFLIGVRKNITATKFIKIDSKDRDVFKILALFKFNSSAASNGDELKSYMYKVSKMPIRLFQWSVNAVKLLLDSIIKEKKHDFRKLKSGVKRLLKKWNIDYSDIDVLLNYTSIFKPMCVTYVQYKGSTTSLKAKRFPKPDPEPTTKRICDAMCMARMNSKKKRTF